MKVKHWVLGSASLAFLCAASGLIYAIPRAVAQQAKDEGAVKSTTESNFEKEVLKSDKPVLVDFYADWCDPCRKLSPTIEALSREYAGKVNFVKINIDDARHLAMKYGVQAIPNVKIFKGGKVISESTGFVSADELKGRLEQAL